VPEGIRERQIDVKSIRLNYFFFFFLAVFFLATFFAFFFAAMFNSSSVCSGRGDSVTPQNVINMKDLHLGMQLSLGFRKSLFFRKFRKPLILKGWIYHSVHG
jgi:hypothetical protein